MSNKNNAIKRIIFPFYYLDKTNLTHSRREKNNLEKIDFDI